MYDIENHRNGILVFFGSSKEKRNEFLQEVKKNNVRRTDLYQFSENEDFEWKEFYKTRNEHRHSSRALFLYEGQQFPDHPGATHLIQSNRTFNTLAVFALEGRHRIKRMVISNADAIFVEKTEDEALQKWYYGLFGSWKLSSFEDFQRTMSALHPTETMVLSWEGNRTKWIAQS